MAEKYKLIKKIKGKWQINPRLFEAAVKDIAEEGQADESNNTCR